MNEDIIIEGCVSHGQACFRGTRIPVHQIVRMMANGDSIDDLLREYPSLTRANVKAGLDYTAYLADEQVIPFDPC